MILKEYLRNRKPEIVQCADVLSLLMLLPSIISLRFRLVYSVIFFYEWQRAALFNLLALAFVKRIVFLAEVLRSDLSGKTLGLKNKFETLSWGVDTARFRPVDPGEKMRLREKLGLPVDKKIIGFIGRYDVWKGHITYLEAARIVAEQRTDVAFLVVGGSPTGSFYPGIQKYQENVDRWIAQHPMGDRLIVWGHRDEVPEIMACLDVFVCPSDYEPFGLVVIEALATGIPVVVGDKVGALEVVNEGDGMYVARSRDAQSFAANIIHALSGPITVNPADAFRHPWGATANEYSDLYSKTAAAA
jgi:glycosyltransferase involved in cell wall biosynthesis